jgi:hypothetical protein
MRALSASEMLQILDEGASLSLCDRALLLLATADRESSIDELASMPIGERDRRLFALRAACFGDVIPLFAHCPWCKEPVELTLSAGGLVSGADVAAGPRELAWGSTLARYRLPDTRDIAGVEALSPEVAERQLVEHCLLEATADGRPIAPGDLTDDLSNALATAMAEADPHADITLDLGCPACARRWPMAFDIVTVLWADVERRGKRLLQEVDALARVYGWREADVLAMSAHRRAMYLEMALS